MKASGKSMEQTRASNARALAAFGVKVDGTGSKVRMIREGKRTTIYTVGYESRDGEELMSILSDQDVKSLADIRQRPISRKPDFRAAALKALCEQAGIEYQAWSCLGSTVEQRENLKSSGDMDAFEAEFRDYAKRVMSADLDRLAKAVEKKPTALLCYERVHEHCHRKIIAELVAERIDATILAL